MSKIDKDPRASSDSRAVSVFSLALLLVGGLFAWQAWGIERTGVSSQGDPGARVFPLALSLALVAGGCVRGVGVDEDEPVDREAQGTAEREYGNASDPTASLAARPPDGDCDQQDREDRRQRPEERP